MFADTETKITSIREIFLPQFVFLDFQASLKNFLGFGPADGNMHSDLFVTTNAEGTHGVAGLACGTICQYFRFFNLGVVQEVIRTVDGCLSTQLFQHFGGSSESVSRFADGDVENKLVNSKLPHGIGIFVFAFCHGESVKQRLSVYGNWQICR